MIILGLDPGLATVGWGAVEFIGSRFKVLGYGTIDTPAHTAIEDRLCTIYDSLNALILKYKPSEVAVEELFFNTNQTTAISVAEARGVMLMCARKQGMKVFGYTPLQVKQSLVGYGRAEKKQVIAMVRIFLGLEKPPRPDDAADALAIAVCHAHSGASKLAEYYGKK